MYSNWFEVRALKRERGNNFIKSQLYEMANNVLLYIRIFYGHKQQKKNTRKKTVLMNIKWYFNRPWLMEIFYRSSHFNYVTDLLRTEVLIN